MQLSNRSQWAKEDFKSGMFGYKNDNNKKNPPSSQVTYAC